jgi:hypothetical protein
MLAVDHLQQPSARVETRSPGTGDSVATSSERSPTSSGMSKFGGSLFATDAQFPDWKSRNWFPLAQDGCGSSWVSYPIDRYPDRRPVCFVNTLFDPHRIKYICPRRGMTTGRHHPQTSNNWACSHRCRVADGN